MAKYLYQRVVQDFQGNIINGAAVTVKITGTNTNAQLYQDEAGTIPLNQPVFSNENGQALFYVDAGLYDIEAKKGLQEAPKLIGVDIGFSTQAGIDANEAATAANEAANEANIAAENFGYLGEWTPGTDVETGGIYGYQGSEFRSLTGVDGIAPSFTDKVNWRVITTTLSRVDLSPFTALDGQTEFSIPSGVDGLQVNRDGTIEQTSQWSYDSDTGVLTLATPCSAGEKIQISYNTSPSSVISAVSESKTVYLTDYVQVGDTEMKQAWDRMLADHGIVSNATSKPLVVKLKDIDLPIKTPMFKPSGIWVDLCGETIIFNCSELDEFTAARGDYYYRRKGHWWSRPDDDVPVRNTFVTADIKDGDAGIILDDVSQIEVGDYLVIDLYDGGYNPLRDYSGFPVSSGYLGQLKGYHPKVQRICKVYSVDGVTKRVVTDYRFGWDIKVSQFPAMTRDGVEYKGLRDKLYLDALWDNTQTTVNQYENGNPMNNVRVFKPSEIIRNTGIFNGYIKDQSPATRVDTAGTERWENFAQYVVQDFYSYDTWYQNVKTIDHKLGLFLGVYNSNRVGENCGGTMTTPLSEGEGYLFNCARGHGYYVDDCKTVGYRHLVDSTCGSYGYVTNCEPIASYAGGPDFNLHGVYEHDFTYTNCGAVGGVLFGFANNNRYTFGGFSKRVKMNSCKARDVYGFCVDLEINGGTFQNLGGIFSPGFIGSRPDDDLFDLDCNLFVGKLTINGATVSGITKVGVDPRVMTEIDKYLAPTQAAPTGEYYASKSEVTAGDVPAKYWYDPYYEENGDINNRFGVYYTNVQTPSFLMSGHYCLSVQGGRVWYTGSTSGRSRCELRNIQVQQLNTIFDRVDVLVNGRLMTCKNTSTMLGDHLFNVAGTEGLFFRDLEAWNYDVNDGVSISLTGSQYHYMQSTAGLRPFSLSRSTPVAAGDLRVDLTCSGVAFTRVPQAFQVDLDNILLTGAITGNSFDVGGLLFRTSGAPVNPPDTIQVSGNNYFGSTNKDNDKKVVSGVNISFSSTTVPANGEIRALIPTSTFGRQMLSTDYVNIAFNNLAEGLTAQAYWDNSGTPAWKVKVVNATGTSKSLLSTIATIFYARG